MEFRIGTVSFGTVFIELEELFDSLMGEKCTFLLMA